MKIAVESMNGPDRFDPSSTIMALFMGQVRVLPDKVALIEDGRRTRYAQLAAMAASIALALRRSGVGRGQRVGLLAGRGTDTVAAQLGIMALGAVFMPLDPGMPGPARMAAVAEGAPAAILCAPGHLAMAAPLASRTCPVISLPAMEEEGTAGGTSADLARLLIDPETRTTPEDPAYVIFTSGSTGRPKGVVVAHRGVCRLVRGQSYADLGPDQVMLNMAAVSFDASIGEIYSAILNGGTLAILPDATPSLDRISQVIARDGVTSAYITAGLFHVIAEHRPEILAPLRQAFPCGDVLSETHVRAVRKALPHLRLVNGYGPTENTVFTCCYPIDAGWTGGPVPIGRGLAHDRIFVLDEALRPLPDGEVGQMAVGGAGIALGYLGRPDLTEAAFVMLEAEGFAGRVYLTGDLVARGADGVVRFHGRLDRQIKINGQRVELDAVEHALRADEGVRDGVAVAVPRPDGSRQVVAFVIPAGQDEGAADAILARMRATLVAAAVPSRIVACDRFPLSDSGKVDRKRLAATLAPALAPALAIEVPPDAPVPQSLRPTTLQTIRQTWADVLGRAVEDETRTFFDLGGTSLQLIAMHAQLQARLGQAFDIAKLFEAPRIPALERLLADPGTEARDPVAERRIVMAAARARRRTNA